MSKKRDEVVAPPLVNPFCALVDVLKGTPSTTNNTDLPKVVKQHRDYVCFERSFSDCSLW